jgi:4a-hydroxytetrahydrobiopterin dehydratase
MKKIDIEQAEPIRKKFAPSWEIRKGTYLYKKVAFNDYNQVLRFLMAIEKPQIKLDHFADFMNFYNELTIAITTHDVKGLTQLDFELALYIDKALEQMDARQLEENFADGKVKGKSRPGRVKRAGASCNGSVTELRKRAKNASGEKAKMYHWCANMKSGKQK